MLLTDRLSEYLEPPHTKALSRLAFGKHLQKDLIVPLLKISKIRQEKVSQRAWINR